MILLDGKIVAKEKTEELKQRVLKLSKKPKLIIIQLGNNFESNKYIKNKIKKAEEIGIQATHIKLDERINENQLITKINSLKTDCDGIIIQLPLPPTINKQKVLDCVDLDIDIDGLSTLNTNNFNNNIEPYFIPATAKAVLMLLEYYKIDLNNKNIVVIGESNLVGKPIKKLLSQFTNNIKSKNKKTGIKGSELADILIVAAGHPHLIKKENIKNGAVVIDVGINTLDNKIIVGDVDFDNVKEKVFAISPSPGGVGPLTIISLLDNLIKKCEK